MGQRSVPSMLQQTRTKFNGYSQLDLVGSALLRVELGLGSDWGRARVAAGVLVLDWATNVARVTARGVRGNAGLRRHEVGLFEIGGTIDPTDMLHISQPDVLSGLGGPDGVGNEGDDISKHYRNSKSARQTQSCRLLDSRIIQMRKLKAAIAWVAPQTAAHR
jgi:hypothetical protein